MSHRRLGNGLVLVCGFALASLGLVFSCGGGDPYCGDGDHDDGEQCDDGNDIDDDECSNSCVAKAHSEFTIKWEFNKGSAPGFTGDSCIDMGVFNVGVRIFNDSADETLSESCSLRQVVFQDLPAGIYGVEVSPVNLNGDLLITEPFATSLALANGSQSEIVIPPEVWLKDYNGTFFFRLLWGGVDCAAALPAVSHVVMTLVQGGVPVAIATTDDADMLDGSAEGPCREFAREFPQSALSVPFGPATFTVVGRATSAGEAEFEETFATFIGAGISNPELHFDINSTAIDAGIPDAAVDSGVDATVYDAGIDAPPGLRSNRGDGF